MNLRSCLLAVLVPALGLAAPASAQFVVRGTTQTRSASYYRSWGLARANLFLDAYGDVSRYTDFLLGVTSTRASGRARAGASIFGYSAEAASIQANAFSNTTSHGGNLSVRLAGFTVYSASHTGATSINRTFGPYNLFNPAPTYSTTIVFVPVTASCNLGAAANAAFVMIEDLLTPRTVSLGGTASAWANGTAQVGVGISGFQAYLQLELRFLQSAATLDANASPTRLDGALNISIVPLRALLKACVEIFWVDNCETIFDWATAAVTFSQAMS